MVESEHDLGRLGRRTRQGRVGWSSQVRSMPQSWEAVGPVVPKNNPMQSSAASAVERARRMTIFLAVGHYFPIRHWCSLTVHEEEPRG